MKSGSGISASLGAILSSLATITCCLPLGFAAALGAGVTSAFFSTLRPWLLSISVLLIALGFWQQYRAKQCAVRGRLVGKILLWAAVVVVGGMILFPNKSQASSLTEFTRLENEEENDNPRGRNRSRASLWMASLGSFACPARPGSSRLSHQHEFQRI